MTHLNGLWEPGHLVLRKNGVKTRMEIFLLGGKNSAVREQREALRVRPGGIFVSYGKTAGQQGLGLEALPRGHQTWDPEGEEQ